MHLRRLGTLILALTFVGLPQWAVCQEPATATAMACCQKDMTHCNQPGKTEDCCRASKGRPDEPGKVVPAAAPDHSVALLSLPSSTPDVIGTPVCIATLVRRLPIAAFPSAPPAVLRL